MVTVPELAGAVAGTLSVAVLPVKVTVTPAGSPVAESATVPLNPLSGVIVMVTVPLEPAGMVRLVGFTDIVKSGGGGGLPPPPAGSNLNSSGVRNAILFVFTVIQSSCRIPPVSPEFGFHDQKVQL